MWNEAALMRREREREREEVRGERCNEIRKVVE